VMVCPSGRKRGRPTIEHVVSYPTEGMSSNDRHKLARSRRVRPVKERRIEGQILRRSDEHGLQQMNLKVFSEAHADNGVDVEEDTNSYSGDCDAGWEHEDEGNGGVWQTFQSERGQVCSVASSEEVEWDDSKAHHGSGTRSWQSTALEWQRGLKTWVRDDEECCGGEDGRKVWKKGRQDRSGDNEEDGDEMQADVTVPCDKQGGGSDGEVVYPDDYGDEGFEGSDGEYCGPREDSVMDEIMSCGEVDDSGVCESPLRECATDTGNWRSSGSMWRHNRPEQRNWEAWCESDGRVGDGRGDVHERTEGGQQCASKEEYDDDLQCGVILPWDKRVEKRVGKEGVDCDDFMQIFEGEDESDEDECCELLDWSEEDGISPRVEPVDIGAYESSLLHGCADDTVWEDDGY